LENKSNTYAFGAAAKAQFEINDVVGFSARLVPSYISSGKEEETLGAGDAVQKEESELSGFGFDLEAGLPIQVAKNFRVIPKVSFSYGSLSGDFKQGTQTVDVTNKISSFDIEPISFQFLF
jgi:outer membrane autotransporter protein